MNVGEYTTLDMVKDKTRKKNNSFFVFFVPSSLRCKRKAIMYYYSPI
jgi:hypothetical protein